MNELATKQNNGAMPVTFNFFDPEQFATMQRVAKMFAYSELVPEIYKVNIPQGADEKAIAMAEMKAMSNCVIALEIASRIGASPLMVMQNLIIIYGRPSWSAKFLISTVNTCGRFEPLQFRFTEKGNLGMVDYVDYVYNPNTRRKDAVNKQFDGRKMQNIECVAYTTKKGREQVLESSPVTIEMAIKEGWFTKSGSKWQSMPKQMLMYRAASWWTSVYAPELSMGMRTVEEEQDIIDITDTAIDVTEQVDREKAERANKTEIKMNVDGDDAPESIEAAKEAPQGANDAPAGQSPTPTPETPSEAPETRSPGF